MTDPRDVRAATGVRRCVCIILLTGCGRLGFDADPSGDAGTAVRRRVTIANGATTTLPVGHAVRIGVAGALGEPSVLAGVRVLSGEMPATAPGLDRIVDLDPPGQDPAVWFALTATIAPGDEDTYWLHVGGDVAPRADATKVFALADDFTGGVLAPAWLTFGAPTVADGLRLGPGDHAVTTDPAADAVGSTSVLEARMTTTAPGAAGTYYWIGFQHEGGFGTGDPFLNWVGEPGVIHPWVNVPAMNRRCADINHDDLPHWYRIERGADTTRYYRDGVLACAVDVIDATDYSIQLRNQSPATELHVDWIRARSLVSPEPTVTLGPEEPGG